MERARRTSTQLIHAKLKRFARINPHRTLRQLLVFIPEFLDFIGTHDTERFVCALPRSWWVYVQAISRRTLYCDRRSCAHRRTGQRWH